jgi:Na+-driven multidrug efflux pump
MIIYPFTVRWGITGAAIAILVSSLAIHGFSLHQATRFSKARPRAVVRAIAFPLVNASVMALVVIGVERLLPATLNLIALILLVGVGALSYAAMTLLSARFLGYDANGLVPRSLSGRKEKPEATEVDSP